MSSAGQVKNPIRPSSPKSGQTFLPKTWDEAVAAETLTKEMAAALVAPDSLTEQISDIARSFGERRRHLRDR